MKIETLRERLAKVEAKIEKKENTIIKKNAQIEKKYAILVKAGVENPEDHDREDFRHLCETDRELWNTIYWTYCDISSLKADIIRGKHEIEETKKTIAKYEAQLSGEIERERLFIKEVPECLKTLESQLIETWDAWDKDRRDRLTEQYQELGYKEFMKKHTVADYKFRYKTDEEIHSANVNDARILVIDLYNRVRGITGEVTDWGGIRSTYGNDGITVLNGVVVGKEGTAKVESILAGGYNIQRLHIRVLVNEI